MNCKFLDHGVAIGNNGVVKPCCTWTYDANYAKKNHVNFLDINEWRQSEEIVSAKQSLSKNIWPDSCKSCKVKEAQGRGDSMRLNGESAYAEYSQNDITLEFRPGNVCNLACQTCWPISSTRVLQYYKKANLNYNDFSLEEWDFGTIENIKHNLQDVILLGGEPFYDPKCIEFLDWVHTNKLKTNLTIFTNGSVLNREYIQNFKNKIKIVFSLDAIGTQSEYIRFGSKWQTVKDNYNFAKSMPNVELCVNITVSPYNYFYYNKLVEWLAEDWPATVTFGTARFGDHLPKELDECVIPYEHRQKIIDNLSKTVKVLTSANIEHYQKINAINAVNANIQRLKSVEFELSKHLQLVQFIKKMDNVKKIKVADYCPEFANILQKENIIETNS